MKRVAVLADIHSNKEALESVLQDIEKRYPEVESFILAGDYIDYGANPDEVIDILRNLPKLASDSGYPMVIRGNHDKAIMENDTSRFRTQHGKDSFEWTRKNLSLRSIEWLSSLKDALESKGILLLHGNHKDVWKNIFPKDTENLNEIVQDNPNAKLIVVAHSHLQFLTEYMGVKILNPGSVGQSRNGIPEAHYAILDTDTYEVVLESTPYDISTPADKIISNRLPKFNATRLFLGI